MSDCNFTSVELISSKLLSTNTEVKVVIQKLSYKLKCYWLDTRFINFLIYPVSGTKE